MGRVLFTAWVACALIVSLPARQSTPPIPRLAWHWNPAPQLADPAARTAFFDLLAAERIGTVWVQVATEPAPSAPGASRAPGPPGPARLARAADWRAFVAEAHRRRVRVEALDGDPAWALKRLHAVPLSVVDAVVGHNATVPPEERFDGIHFDIEPYLLIGWRYPRSRESLLRELIELATACQARVRQAGGLQFGVDIPYWWDSLDHRTGRPIGETEFEGVRKSAAQHLIDRLDNVGIMNYRNHAAGDDGLIANGTPTLAYADAAKRARIYMGVETSLSDPTDVWFVAGVPTEVVDERLASPASDVTDDGRFFGFTLRLLDDGTSTHPGLVAPKGMGEDPAPAFRDALVHLGRHFSANADPRFRATAAERRDRGMRAASRDPERRNLRARVIHDERERLDYLAFVATSIMLPKLTFFGLAPDVLARELAAAEAAFSRHPSFGGMAIHDADSLRGLVTGQR